ncbi:thermonuclease family protein [Rhizobium leguminosarum]|uniref:thermonuclease family protein n=1 Tax=Rhizobium leguminosarum TaxID=384 RepID=UPI001C983A60|nr:thermonuclease family protein [Rhizobium leguminosarum]MBY5744650.1 thermonuclease family protein [Rhizobium leguminosarum]
MLTEVEVTYFRSRIDDVLGTGRISAWQRDFLLGMRQKIERYGARTRFSEKQLATLKRLTSIQGDADLRLVVSNIAPRRQRRPRYWGLSYREQKFIIMAAVLAILAIASISRQIAHNFHFSLPVNTPGSSQSRDFSITDGDTIKMDDGTPVRLIGFNTPEKFEPRCDHERELGIRASKRLVEIVSSGKSTVTRVACSCKLGTGGTSKCNYGRSCGILRVDGRDVGQTLISEGLAVPFICGAGGCPPTPRPWCG